MNLNQKFTQTNMSGRRRRNSYWQDVAQDNKVPLTRLSTRACEDGNGTPSPSTESTQLGSPSGQHSTDSGPQQRSSQRTTRNRRNYENVKWSIEEKRIILYCFAYSRYEKWGRKKKVVFEEKIREADLPTEKKENTTANKLISIVSQLSVYLSQEEIKCIEDQAFKDAESKFQLIEEKEKQEYGKSSWNRKEKWVLLWATEYAKIKHKNQRESCKEWQKILFHHCPNKTGTERSKLTTQKHNILTQKVFNESEINEMKKTVNYMYRNNICPLTEPPDVPTNNMDQRTQATTDHSHKNPQIEDEIVSFIQRTRAEVGAPEPPDSPPSSSNSESDEPSSPERPRRARRDRGGQTPPRPTNLRQNEDPEQQELEEELANKIEETRQMGLDERPRLTKLRENKKFKELLKRVNIGLKKMIPLDATLPELNHANYGAAWLIQSKITPEYAERKKDKPRNKNVVPHWKKKLQQKIERLRAEISQISNYLEKQNPSRNIRIKINKMKRKYNINEENLNEKRAEHQATVKALAAQLRNKERKIRMKQINKQFAENPRMVYRSLNNESIEVQNPPSREQVEGFWKPLFEDPKQHQESQWIDTIKEKKIETKTRCQE